MDVKQGIAAIIAAHKSVPLSNTPTDTVEPLEILSERKESMKVFDAGNGRRTAHIYACPIHYRDNDGTFRAIDPSVKRKPLLDPLQTHKYETKSGLYHAHFKDTKPWDYRLQIGDSWIEYEAQFYESDVLTIKVETSRAGVKETISLLDKTAPTKLSWKVTRSGTGIITPPPVAVDADGKPMVVAVSQDGDVLTYDVDVTDAVFPVIVDPTSITATNDGLIYSTGAVYTTVRNAETGTASATSQVTIGQNATPTVNRAFLSFVLPEMASVSAASLFLDGNGDYSTTDFNVYIHTATYSDPLVKEDFDLFDGRQASGPYNGTVLNNAWNSSSYSADWNEFVFNAAGLVALLVKQNDTFKMAMISEEDYNGSAPADSESVIFEPSTTADKEPYLSITYTIAVVEAVSALVEMEAVIPGIWDLTREVSALIEIEAEVTAIKAKIEAVSALLEVEADITAKWEAITALSALIEMEVSVTGVSTHILNLVGSITPVGSLVEQMIIVISVGGEITPSGGVSLANPMWIPVKDNLRWMGEWSATQLYEVEDVVMYKTAEGKYHGFISRTPHNIGNIPTESYAHWARIVQARWKK